VKAIELAELGFAAVIDLKHAGIWILWDAGIAPITPDGPAGVHVPGNLRLLRERSCDMMSVDSARSSGRRHYVLASHHVESLREEQQEPNVAARHQLLLQSVSEPM
jgi:hypothetical protein